MRFASFALLLVPLALVRAQTFTMTPLDGQGTLTTGHVEVVNKAGQRAGGGLLIPQVNDQPVIWNGDVPSFLPLLPGDDLGLATGLSDAGIAVGTSTELLTIGGGGTLVPHPVRWSGGVVTDLRLVPTGPTTLLLQNALDINEAGVIVGDGLADGGAGERRGWILSGSTLTDLGSLGGPGAFTQPHRLDDQGRVVGTSAISAQLFSASHAFVWQGGAMHDLHDATQIGGQYSEAIDINAHGQICGWAEFGGLASQSAALWQPDGTILNLDPGDLPGIPTGSNSVALDMNDAGDVVGVVYENAFLWRDGVMQDLNSLVVPGQPPEFILGVATSIDDDGRITAFGFGGPMPVLLVPTCDGHFTVYGSGSAGSGGFVPALAGEGCPVAGGNVALDISAGAGGAPGLLLLGTGSGTAPFKGCLLQNLPLLPVSLPLLLGGSGPGAGGTSLSATLPAMLPSITLRLQAAFADDGAPSGVSVSNPLIMKTP